MNDNTLHQCTGPYLQKLYTEQKSGMVAIAESQIQDSIRLFAECRQNFAGKRSGC